MHCENLREPTHCQFSGQAAPKSPEFNPTPRPNTRNLSLTENSGKFVHRWRSLRSRFTAFSSRWRSVLSGPWLTRKTHGATQIISFRWLRVSFFRFVQDWEVGDPKSLCDESLTEICCRINAKAFDPTSTFFYMTAESRYSIASECGPRCLAILKTLPEPFSLSVWAQGFSLLCVSIYSSGETFTHRSFAHLGTSIIVIAPRGEIADRSRE